jgi:2-dehydro-3-deoxyphosphogluconate aldolase/(4S)-4-hydroxy-2-oxoglutarate aldolase
MESVLQRIGSIGILPGATVLKPGEAIPLGKALLEGNLPALELRFNETTDEVLRSLVSELPELAAGALVRTASEAKRAVEAGAKFISTAAFNPEVVNTCLALEAEVLPGAGSPRDIEESLALGVPVTRFFPSECSRGADVLSTFADAWPEMRFIPAGGVTPENASRYLSLRNVLAIRAGWIAERHLIESEHFEEIVRRADEALLAIHNFGLLHIGINNEREEDAVTAARKLSFLFGFRLRERPNSMFADPGFELMKTPDLGKNGHVAIGVNDIPRALTYLRQKGVSPIAGTERYQDDGSLRRVYLDLEISGFAFHLRSYK